jgi:diguanylate cyclase (GGDEF)-like protein
MIDNNELHKRAEEIALIKEHLIKITANTPLTDYEHRVILPDGTVRWQYWTHIGIYSPGGNLLEYQAVGRDITGSKQAEKELELTNGDLEMTLALEQQLARTDGLTGIYNRRYFFELAEREFIAALCYSRQLSIILFDVDNLKQVNDTFGHAAGDILLVKMAQTSALQLRAVDELARYGGDEFIILLPQTGAQQAFPIAERIRGQIAAMRLETDKNFVVTLSIGIAETKNEPADVSVKAVISRADKALYKAKEDGRSRTVIYCEE